MLFSCLLYTCRGVFGGHQVVVCGSQKSSTTTFKGYLVLRCVALRDFSLVIVTLALANTTTTRASELFRFTETCLNSLCSERVRLELKLYVIMFIGGFVAIM